MKNMERWMPSYFLRCYLRLAIYKYNGKCVHCGQPIKFGNIYIEVLQKIPGERYIDSDCSCLRCFLNAGMEKTVCWDPGKTLLQIKKHPVKGVIIHTSEPYGWVTWNPYNERDKMTDEELNLSLVKIKKILESSPLEQSNDR